jgi:hypothetical protein
MIQTSPTVFAADPDGWQHQRQSEDNVVARLIGPGLFLVDLRHELHRTSQEVSRKTDISWRDPIGGLQHEAESLALASAPGWTFIDNIREHRPFGLIPFGFIESASLLRQLGGALGDCGQAAFGSLAPRLLSDLARAREAESALRSEANPWQYFVSLSYLVSTGEVAWLPGALDEDAVRLEAVRLTCGARIKPALEADRTGLVLDLRTTLAGRGSSNTARFFPTAPASERIWPDLAELLGAEGWERRAIELFSGLKDALSKL